MATLILKNCNLNNTFNADILLVEIDERFIKKTFKPNILTHLLITNITRDQTSRNIHPDYIFNDIFDNIGKNTHLIINADVSTLNKIKLRHKGKITTYGVNITSKSYYVPKINNLDDIYCPKCYEKFDYEFYHYGNLGNYKCPSCDYSRGKLDYLVDSVDFKNGQIQIQKQTINLDQNVLYAVYYMVASYAVCSVIGIDKKEVVKHLNSMPKYENKKFLYKLGNREVELLDSKNENALAYDQSLTYIKDFKGKKTVVLGFDKVSRRHKHNDISWLWDVEYENLNEKEIVKIVCIGKFKYDIATRLIYAGICEEKLIFVDDLNNLIEVLRNETSGNIFIVFYYDILNKIISMLKKVQNGNN